MNTTAQRINGQPNSAKNPRDRNALTPCETAIDLLHRGKRPIPLHPAGSTIKTKQGSKIATGKEPIGSKWGELEHTEEGLHQIYRDYPAAGVGILLGPRGGIVDVEIDGEGGEASFLKLCDGEEVSTMGWSSRRGPHKVFRWDDRLADIDPQRRAVLKLPDLAGLELRLGQNLQAQSACPPTVGEDGTPRVWNGVETIAALPEIAFAYLAKALARKPAPPVEPERKYGKIARGSGPLDVEERARRWLDKVDPAISGQHGHDVTFRAAVGLVRGFGLPPAVALAMLQRDYSGRCDPPWSDGELQHKIDAATKASCEKPDGWLRDSERNKSSSNRKPPKTPKDDGEGRDRPEERPLIEVSTERHLVVEEAIEALVSDPSLYQRGESLVSVIQETKDEIKLTAATKMKGLSGSPKIIDLSDSVISCHLTKSARFYQWRKDKSGEPIVVDVHPPDWLIKGVATHKHWTGIRPLEALVECPFPRPDGTIVETPGYDVETACLYLPTQEFPKLSANPKQSEAVAAWNRLKRYVRQFPFASEEDRVVFLAGVLNVVARPAVKGPVPGIAVVGNKAGTGKGLLVDAMTMPATGRPASTTSYPSDNIEATKVKTAIVMSGRPVVSFDNLDEGSMYGGSAIDSALTALTLNERILGLSKNTGEIPVRVTWFLNGNNLSPGKDAHRRWMVANLTTDLEYPDRRADIEDKSLRALILENRGEMVRDALTILKAHALAGRPTEGGAPLGSFEEWDRVVRAAVWFATGLDCLATQRKTADDSPDRLAKIAVLEGWQELPGGSKGGLTTGEAIALIEKNPDSYQTFRGVMIQRGRGGKPASPVTIGLALRSLKNTPTGGLKLKDTGIKRHGAVCWIVEGTRTEDPKAKGEDKGTREDGLYRSVQDLSSNADVITSLENTKTCQDALEPSSLVPVPSPTKGEREVGFL